MANHQQHRGSTSANNASGPSSAMQQILGSAQKSWMTGGSTNVPARQTSRRSPTRRDTAGTRLDASAVAPPSIQDTNAAIVQGSDRPAAIAGSSTEHPPQDGERASLASSQLRGVASHGIQQVSIPAANDLSSLSGNANARPVNTQAILPSSPGEFVTQFHDAERQCFVDQVGNQSQRLIELAAKYGGVEELEKRLRLASAPTPGLSTPGNAISRPLIGMAEPQASRNAGFSNNEIIRRVSAPHNHVSGHTNSTAASTIGEMSQMNDSPRQETSGFPKWNLLTQQLHFYQYQLNGDRSSSQSKPLIGGRLLTMVEACGIQDLEYLILHQVYCLHDTSEPGKRVLNLTNDHVSGLRELQLIMIPNRALPPESLLWFAKFPVDLSDKSYVPSGIYLSALQNVKWCLIMFGRNYRQVMTTCMREEVALSINDMERAFGATSATLQRIVFTAITRSFWQRASRQCGCFESVMENLSKTQFDLRQCRLFRTENPSQSRIAEGQSQHSFFLSFNRWLLEHKSHSEPRGLIRNPHLPTIAPQTSITAIGKNSQQPNGAHFLPLRSSSELHRQQFNALGNGSGNYPSDLSNNPHRPFSNSVPQSPLSPAIRAGSSQPVREPMALPNQPIQPIRASITQTNHPTSQRDRRPSLQDIQQRSPSFQSHPSHGVPMSDPLYPTRDGARQQIANPPPVGVQFHQAHLRDPAYVHDQTNGQKETARYYSYLREFLLKPYPIEPGTQVIIGDLYVDEAMFKRIPHETPDKFGGPVSRVLQTGSLTFQVRCIKCKSDDRILNIWPVTNTSWPSSVSMELNDSCLEIRRKYHHGKDLPIDITMEVNQGHNKLQVALLRDPKAADTDEKYFFGIEVIEFGSADNLRAMIRSNSAATTEQRIQQQLSTNDDDIEILSKDLVIWLLDPYTARQIEVPVRGEFCVHYECFDLEVFLLTRAGNPCRPEDFKCPICGSDARPQSLFLDAWFQAVLERLKQDGLGEASAIVVDKRAQWKVKEEEEEGETGDGSGRLGRNASTPRVKLGTPPREIEVIELD